MSGVLAAIGHAVIAAVLCGWVFSLVIFGLAAIVPRKRRPLSYLEQAREIVYAAMDRQGAAR